MCVEVRGRRCVCVEVRRRRCACVEVRYLRLEEDEVVPDLKRRERYGTHINVIVCLAGLGQLRSMDLSHSRAMTHRDQGDERRKKAREI